MSKKRMHQILPQNEDRNMVISGEELRRKTKNRGRITFSMGKHMMEKDRPRKKKWDIDDE